jgi:hypothetical protein
MLIFVIIGYWEFACQAFFRQIGIYAIYSVCPLTFRLMMKTKQSRLIEENSDNTVNY